MTAKPTPESVFDALDAAEAETRRLRENASNIRQAASHAGQAARLEGFRADAQLASDYRQRRDAAHDKLVGLTHDVETPFSELVVAIAAAFADRQVIEADCVALRRHLGPLDQVDPLPATRAGAGRVRAFVVPMYTHEKLQPYIDEAIHYRAERRAAVHYTELTAALASKIDAAEHAAGRRAAGAPDGHLDVEQPPSMAEQLAHAAATIDDDSLDPDKVRAAGIHTVRHNAVDAELDRLVRAEQGESEQ
jgi:hypothetical protein